jgi:Type II secretion system (T2SS), protein M subtype b
VTFWRRILRENRKLVLLLVVAALINVGLFALVVLPLSRRVQGGEVLASNAAAALASARREHDNARAMVSGKSSADAELKKFYQEVLPPDVSGARRITYLKLDQIAHQADLRMLGRTSDPSVERGSTLGKLTIDMRLAGDYKAVRRFIYALETAPEFLVLENVALVQGDDRSRGINVNVQVATYYRAGGDGN